jgi:hypothetical protein
MAEDNLNEVFDAAFRIIGDVLDPDYINSLLGIKPDHSHRKGDPNNRKGKLGKVVVGSPHKTGVWTIYSLSPETSSLEEHLLFLINKLQPVGDTIMQLSKEGYRIDIYCGYFLKHGFHGGFDISPKLMEALVKMGISLSISVHEM